MAIIVRHGDIRTLRFCNRGGREFFEKHGLDWSKFLEEGIAAAELAKLNDHMANQAIEEAERRLKEEGAS